MNTLCADHLLTLVTCVNKLIRDITLDPFSLFYSEFVSERFLSFLLLIFVRLCVYSFFFISTIFLFVPLCFKSMFLNVEWKKMKDGTTFEDIMEKCRDSVDVLWEQLP